MILTGYFYMNMQAYLLAVYSIGFNHLRAFLNQKKHLRHVMLYCFKKDDSANDIADEICTVLYGGITTTIMTIRNWFMSFKVGNFDLKDEGRSGRPAATNIDLIKAMLAENPRYNVCEIVNATNILKTTVTLNLHKLFTKP
ncbi:histone-lysine N-methyltransferase SETMAR-like [Apis dorsata]|uniref:histone-lysine N-methyltransferase SETMAR-like n=1 Tax=Apis dorsata TaxID=7462 RepID=UPI0003DF55EE|nr:histone-lysine N-methyltransferase SETMAR-like [Apis dorsata]